MIPAGLNRTGQTLSRLIANHIEPIRTEADRIAGIVDQETLRERIVQTLGR